MNKPCENCTSCQRPENCRSLTCTDWREWFAQAWDEACERIRAALADEQGAKE